MRFKDKVALITAVGNGIGRATAHIMAAEGAVVTWLGLRERRTWLRAGGLMLFAVAIVRLGVLQFSAPSAGQLVLMNRRGLCGLFVIGLTYALTFAHQRYSTSDRRHAQIGAGLLVAKLLLLALAATLSGANDLLAIHGG